MEESSKSNPEIEQHILMQYPEAERVAYLSLVTPLCYVDAEFSEAEKILLETFFDDLQLSNQSKSKIFAAIYYLSDTDKERYLELLQALENSELKYALISDLCMMSFADDELSDEEQQYIRDMGGVLGISAEEISAIQYLQENLAKLRDEVPTSERFKAVLADSAANLTAAGIPIAAISVSGSVAGLSAAGITSGLAALGGVIGGGMVAGTVLVVPALAAGSVYTVKKLIDNAPDLANRLRKRIQRSNSKKEGDAKQGNHEQQ